MTDISDLVAARDEAERRLRSLRPPSWHTVHTDGRGRHVVMRNGLPDTFAVLLSGFFMMGALFAGGVLSRVIMALSLAVTVSLWLIWGSKARSARCVYDKKRSALQDELDAVNREIDDHHARQERVALAALRADLLDMYGVTVATDSLAPGHTYLAQTPRGVEHLQLVTYGGSFRLMRGNQEVERIA